MKNKLVKNGAVLALFFLSGNLIQQGPTLTQGVGQCQASRIFQKAVHQSYLNLDEQSDIENKGIFDKVVNKMTKEEEKEREEKDKELLTQQFKYEKAVRHAMLITSPLRNPLEDVQQIIKNVELTQQLSKKPKETYEQQVAKIASQQEEYQDEYGGFGSLTEMIKNKDKIAEQVAQNISEEQKKKEDLVKMKDQQKRDAIAQAKAKMTAALNKDLQNKQVAKQQSQSSNTTTASGSSQMNSNNSLGPKEKEKLNVASQTNNTSQSVTAQNNTVVSDKQQIKQSQDKTIKDSKNPNSSQQQSASTKSTEKKDFKKEEKDSSQSPVSQQSVSQIIDEVQMEQEAAQNVPAPVKANEEQSDKSSYQTYGESQNDEHQGFIGKFTKKFSNLNQGQQEKNPADFQQAQTDDQEPSKPRKSMADRFADQVAQDEQDNEKAKQLVQQVQHAMDKKSRSPIENATEKIMKEVDEENNPQLSDTVNIVDSSLTDNQQNE